MIRYDIYICVTSLLEEIQGYFCSVFIVSNNCYGKGYENWAYILICQCFHKK